MTLMAVFNCRGCAASASVLYLLLLTESSVAGASCCTADSVNLAIPPSLKYFSSTGLFSEVVKSNTYERKDRGKKA